MAKEQYIVEDLSTPQEQAARAQAGSQAASMGKSLFDDYSKPFNMNEYLQSILPQLHNTFSKAIIPGALAKLSGSEQMNSAVGAHLQAGYQSVLGNALSQAIGFQQKHMQSKRALFNDLFKMSKRSPNDTLRYRKTTMSGWEKALTLGSQALGSALGGFMSPFGQSLSKSIFG